MNEKKSERSVSITLTEKQIASIQAAIRIDIDSLEELSKTASEHMNRSIRPTIDHLLATSKTIREQAQTALRSIGAYDDDPEELL